MQRDLFDDLVIDQKEYFSIDITNPPDEYKKMVEKIKPLEYIANYVYPYGFLAGGAILNEMLNKPIKDFDIFSFDYKDTINKLELEKYKATKLISDTENAVTLLNDITPNAHRLLYPDIPIQFIKRDYTSIIACLDRFDLTCCQWALYGNNLFTNPFAIKSIINKKITLNTSALCNGRHITQYVSFDKSLDDIESIGNTLLRIYQKASLGLIIDEYQLSEIIKYIKDMPKNKKLFKKLSGMDF